MTILDDGFCVNGFELKRYQSVRGDGLSNDLYIRWMCELQLCCIPFHRTIFTLSQILWGISILLSHELFFPPALFSFPTIPFLSIRWSRGALIVHLTEFSPIHPNVHRQNPSISIRKCQWRLCGSIWLRNPFNNGVAWNWKEKKNYLFLGIRKNSTLMFIISVVWNCFCSSIGMTWMVRCRRRCRCVQWKFHSLLNRSNVYLYVFERQQKGNSFGSIFSCC